MELEDYVEKLQKQKKLEKKERKLKEKDEKTEVKLQRRKLMRFTSSQKLRISKIGLKHKWKVFKERRKNYYNYARGVVYLSSIPHGFFEEQMASYFSQFGKVTGIYMPRAPSGKIRGYAFIEFQLEVIAKIVAETMNNYLFYQRILKAKYIPPAEQKPCMFVWPFADKKKKSVRIEAELKRRQIPLSEDQVESYKRKVEKRMKKKVGGAEYCIQVSGAAPAPLPSQQPNEKKKLAKAKLKQIAAEAKKSTPSVNEKSAEKEKLAKQIKKNIAAKLARPLKKKAKKNKPDSEEEKPSESDDDFHSADDFETADETSFFDNDANEKFHDTINMDFDYDTSDGDDDIDHSDSPSKKIKLSKPAKSATPKGTLQTKSAKNTPKSAGKVQKSPQSLKKAISSVNKTPKNVPKAGKTDSPLVAKKVEKTPKSAAKSEKQETPSVKSVQKTPKSGKKLAKESIPTPPISETKQVTVKTPKQTKPVTPSDHTQEQNLKSAKKTKLSAQTVKPLLAKAKNTPALNSPKSVGKLKSKSVGIGTPKSEGKFVVLGTPKSAGKLKEPKSVGKLMKEKSELKRKSMSDVKKSKLMNVVKKRRSLPK